MHTVEITLSDHEWAIITDKARKCEMSVAAVIRQWMRYGQAVEVRAAGRTLFADGEELFPSGPGLPSFDDGYERLGMKRP